MKGEIKVGRRKNGARPYSFGTFRDHSWDIRNWAAMDSLFILLLHFDKPLCIGGVEYHYFDLIGLEARKGPKKTLIGYVTDLIKGGNDLLEIELLEGKKVLVPFVKEIIPEIEIKEKWLLINPPPGLLEL